MSKSSKRGKFVGRRRGVLAARALSVSVLLNSGLLSNATAAEQPKITGDQCDYAPTAVNDATPTEQPNSQWIYLAGQGSIKRLEYFRWGRSKANQTIIYVQGDVNVKKYQNAPECFAGLLQLSGATLTAITNRLPISIIFLARPGHYGSSGSLNDRRKPATYKTISLAINKLALQQRNKQVALVGHSGGASAIAGAMLLGKLPSNCIVLASGAYSFAALVAHQRKTGVLPPAALATEFTRSDASAVAAVQAKRAKQYSSSNYDVLPHVWGEKFVSTAKIHLVQDPNDQVVPWTGLIAFRNALERNDYNVQLHSVVASDEKHHGTVGHAIGIATRCMKDHTQLQSNQLR
jgi:pimeloyl-ACP methyl ester carboxylesterase